VNKYEERMMDLGLDEIVGGATPPDLSEKIAVAARGLAIAPPPRRPSRLAASILIAASLLVGAFVLWKILSTPERPPLAPSPTPAQDKPREKLASTPEPGALQRLAAEMESDSRLGDPDPRRRAEAWLTVTGSVDVAARARYKAGLCYRSDGIARWAKNSKDPGALEGLRLAEETFLVVQKDPAGELLQPLAHFELASLYLHPGLSQPDRAQEFLDRCLKAVPEGDPWFAPVLGLQVRCHLESKKLGPAADVLDRLLERFPEAPESARMSKQVAIRLDEAVNDMIRTNAEGAVIEKNLRRMARYYATWVNFGPMHGMRITPADVLHVADTLHLTARRINHLGDEALSAQDLGGKKVAEPGLFKDAAMLMSLALSTSQVNWERITLGTRRARCLTFAAQDAAGWREARDAYQDVLKPLKLVQANGLLDPQVLEAHRELIAVYLELGSVQFELGKSGLRPSFDEASTVFSNVSLVAQAGSEPWWTAKYMVLAVLYERGGDGDLKLAKVGLENLERQSPNFDGGRFGMNGRFAELKKKIDEARGK
jgi:hypothetical protein